MLKCYRYSKSQSWLVSGTGLLAQRGCLVLCAGEEHEPLDKAGVYAHITLLLHLTLVHLEVSAIPGTSQASGFV